MILCSVLMFDVVGWRAGKGRGRECGCRPHQYSWPARLARDVLSNVIHLPRSKLAGGTVSQALCCCPVIEKEDVYDGGR